MKEKIMNIRNILKIIISIFVIFSFVKSCAKAVTYDDVKEYVENTADYFPNNSVYQQLKSNVNLTSVQNGLNAMNISNYDNFIVWSHQVSRGTDINYIFFNATTWNSSSQSISFQGQYISGYYSTYWNQWYGSNTINNNNISNILAEGAFYSRTENNYNNLRAMMYTFENFETTPVTFVGMQAVNTNPLYFGHLFSTSATYESQELEVIKTLYSYSQTSIEDLIGYTSGETINITLTNTSNNQIFENTFKFNNSQYIGGSNKSFYAYDLGDYLTIGIDTRLIYFNTIYSLEVTQGENTIQEYILFMPNGTIIENGTITTIPSGDFNYTTQDSTNDIIDNQDKTQNWLEETYNNLFVLESGDVTKIINDLQDKVQISNMGDLSGEKAILETLTGEPGDFVIAWTPTRYMNKVIIPSGEVNFSQKVREVPALKTTQDWLRIIMGYSITIVLLSEIFFTILKVLGVSVSIYEQHNEEIERLEEMHTPKVYLTEVATPKGNKKYYTRRTRIK